MNYFMVLFVLIGIMGSFLTLNAAYGLWVPLSLEELMQQSKTVFVGKITGINPVDVEYQSQMARNGTIKESVGSETMTLEEYTVDVEEFLKNPQDTNMMKVLRATVSGVPTGPAKISGFDVGDRVLFYLPKDEKQTHFAEQYLPESFRIPEQCNVVDVLNSKRIEGRNSFTKMQNSVEIKDNFTAGIPIQFRYDRDMGTLFGQTFEVSVGINKVDDNAITNVFHKIIPVNIDPCKWAGSAQWKFVPQEGEYRMNVHVSTEGGGSGSSTHFSVIGSSKAMSPLNQFNLGTPFDEIQCKENLILIQKYDGSPACVKPETSAKLVGRGWTTPVSEWPGLTPITPELGKFGTYELEKDGIEFDIKYYIKGGSDIKEIIPDIKYNAISIILEPHDSGSLEITIPRELIDAKVNEGVDDLFFVLIDRKEVPYTETANDLTRTLTIKFDKSSQEIEIIGTMPI